MNGVESVHIDIKKKHDMKSGKLLTKGAFINSDKADNKNHSGRAL